MDFYRVLMIVNDELKGFSHAIYIIYSFLSRVNSRVLVNPRTFPFSIRALSVNSSKETILAASLNHVQTYGWTEEAIVQGVLSSGLPPSYIGRVEHKQSDLIHYFMKTSNENLKNIVK